MTSVAWPSAAPTTISSANRIESLGILRLLAIFAVICLHTSPFSNYRIGDLDIVINLLARFAVPFFFVTSGYLWARKRAVSNDQGDASAYAFAKRILGLFLFWSIFYLLPYNVSSIFEYGILGPVKASYWSIAGALSHPVKTFFLGTEVHLWFLMSLAMAMGISWFVLRIFNCYILLAIGIIFFAIGLFIGPYQETPLGINLDVLPRTGPLFSTLLFAFGIFMAQWRRMTPNAWLLGGCLILGIGWILQYLEFEKLTAANSVQTVPSFIVTTPLLGIGSAMIGLSNHPLLRNSSIDRLSRYVLGIYAVHFAFVVLLAPTRTLFISPLWEITFPVIVLVLSILASIQMAKVPRLKPFVS